MKRIFYSFATLLAVVLLASCSSEKDGTACLKLIPEDAALVMRFDLKAVGEATNYANDKATKDELKKLVSDIPGDKDVKEKIKAIIENPSESGISTEHPVYFYLAPNVSNMIGLVGTTGDKDKFVELLQLIADESNLDDVEEYEGISCLELGVAAFLVADDWFYVGAGFENLQKGKVDLEERAKDLKELASADKAPIMEKPDFKAMTEKKGQFQVLLSGRGIDAFFNKAKSFGANNDVKEVQDAMKKILPGKLSDISLLGNANFEKGVSTGTMEVLTYSNEWKNAISEFDGIMGNITPEVAKYLSADGIAVLANIDGGKLFALIEKVAAKFGKDLNEDEDFVEVRNFVSTINGDMGLGISSIDNDSGEGVAYISTKDASILSLLTQNAADNEDLKQNGENDYTVYNYNYDYNYYTGDLEKTDLQSIINFGYRDGLTYFVLNSQQKTNPFDTPAKPLSTANIKGKGFYMYMNYELFTKLTNGDMNDEMLKELSKDFDFVEAYYEGNGKFVGRSEMKDKNKSLLRVYMDMLNKFLPKL